MSSGPAGRLAGECGPGDHRVSQALLLLPAPQRRELAVEDAARICATPGFGWAMEPMFAPKALRRSGTSVIGTLEEIRGY